MKDKKKYDYIIVGGGIFGIYAAIFLAKKKLSVCLIEKEAELLKKASIVNQARLHAGYHYPRSYATAMIADEHKGRFMKDHEQFINFKFDQLYAIDMYSSFTDSKQFVRFCNSLDIKCERVKKHPLVDYTRIEDLFNTTEYSFDPIMIAEYYRRIVTASKGVDILMNTHVTEAYSNGGNWFVKLENDFLNTKDSIQAPAVINATYCGTNTTNRLFGIEPVKLMHEITEMAMVNSAKLKDFGLTIMDGHFVSIMPYGLSGLHSLSSVTYTHHKVSYEDEPTFDCQGRDNTCRPDLISICNSCKARPDSNYYKMIRQVYHYLSKEIDMKYFFSMYTIKSKLQSSFIDDGRPTIINKLSSGPDFFCLFAGKINSIYEIEKFVDDEL